MSNQDILSKNLVETQKGNHEKEATQKKQIDLLTILLEEKEALIHTKDKDIIAYRKQISELLKTQTETAKELAVKSLCITDNSRLQESISQMDQNLSEYRQKLRIVEDKNKELVAENKKYKAFIDYSEKKKEIDDQLKNNVNIQSQKQTEELNKTNSLLNDEIHILKDQLNKVLKQNDHLADTIDLQKTT